MGGKRAMIPNHHKPTAELKKVTGWNKTMNKKIFAQSFWSFWGLRWSDAPIHSMRYGESKIIHIEMIAPRTYKMQRVICQSSPNTIISSAISMYLWCGEQFQQKFKFFTLFLYNSISYVQERITFSFRSFYMYKFIYMHEWQFSFKILILPIHLKDCYYGYQWNKEY